MRIYTLLLASLLFGTPAFCISPAEEQVAESVIGQVLSPFCPGRMLNDCPTQAASDLKDFIRAEVASGKTPAVITQSLISQYGEAILASPPAAGVGLLVWVGPGLFVLIGAVILVGWLRRDIKESV